MPQNVAVVKTAIVAVVGSTGNIVLSAASAVAITEQLNIAQPFLHLYLPLWFGYLMVFILALVGAVGSLFTDTMQHSKAGKAKNFFMGFLLGIIGAFVILPNLTTKPPTFELMFITSLAFAFSGVVLLNNLSVILHSDMLKNGMVNAAGEAGGIVKNRFLKALKVFFGMDDSKGGES